MSRDRFHPVTYDTAALLQPAWHKLIMDEARFYEGHNKTRNRVQCLWLY